MSYKSLYTGTKVLKNRKSLENTLLLYYYLVWGCTKTIITHREAGKGVS